MKFLVVYESMYGNTHQVADCIGDGLRQVGEVEVCSVHDVTPAMVASATLVVVGGPTHVHGMSRPSTRRSALDAAAKPGSDLTLDPDAEGPGLRDWFDALGKVDYVPAAAFDTRVDVNPVLGGRASKGIAKRLHQHGFNVVAEPQSFLVDKQSRLEPGEAERARAWGAGLANEFAPAT